jgi:hypothetical protein
MSLLLYEYCHIHVYVCQSQKQTIYQINFQKFIILKPINPICFEYHSVRNDFDFHYAYDHRNRTNPLQIYLMSVILILP